MTSLIVTAEYDTQTIQSGNPALAIAHMMSIAFNDGSVMNPFPTTVVKFTLSYRWWDEEIGRIDPAHRTQTLQVGTFQLYMNYLNDGFPH